MEECEFRAIKLNTGDISLNDSELKMMVEYVNAIRRLLVVKGLLDLEEKEHHILFCENVLVNLICQLLADTTENISELDKRIKNLTGNIGMGATIMYKETLKQKEGLN